MKKWTFKAYGGGDSIGGSSYVHNDNIQVDHGAIQEGKRIRYPAIGKEDIELFLLSHDHLDHCGGVPIFLREHPESRVMMTKTSFEGMNFLLKDSVKIAESRAEIDSLRGIEPELPKFSLREVDNLVDRVDFIGDTSWFSPIAGHKISFRSAGHKPGAAMFLMVFPDGTRVLHACDISLDEQALVRKAGVPKDFLNPDVMVVEATYGNRELPDRTKEKARLEEVVRKVFARGGKVVIPHFASTLANCALPLAEAGFPVHVDGMGRDFTHLYANSAPWCEQDKPFKLSDFGSLFLVDGGCKEDDRFYRRDLVRKPEPVVIVSSSGMLEAGPSVGYVEELLEDSRNAVILPGHKAKDTQSRKLTQLAKGEKITFFHQYVKKIAGRKPELREWTETRQINADVIPFKLSGHSGGDKMAEWIAKINPAKVVTVHGEPEAHEGLKERTQSLKKDIEFFTAKNGQTLEFSF
ncbi:MAG: MBL fold metallo-hydrolase [bacterium]|nr:MBL fold metallo-hydrolase [bacterium]